MSRHSIERRDQRAIDLSVRWRLRASFSRQWQRLDGVEGVGVVVPPRAQKALMRQYFPELAAAYFHLYGIERDDKRKDEAAHGEYRTKRVILAIYNEMTVTMRTGMPYPTRLDPPPADPRVAHPDRRQQV